MKKSQIRTLTSRQADRQAFFQRQLLNDLLQYIRQDPALPLASRDGLHRLQTTLSANIRALEKQSITSRRESLIA